MKKEFEKIIDKHLPYFENRTAKNWDADILLREFAYEIMKLTEAESEVNVEAVVSDAEPIIYEIETAGKIVKTTPFQMLSLLINSFPDDKSYEGKETQAHWDKIEDWLTGLIRKARAH